MVMCFDRADGAEVERVRVLCRDLLEICLDLGFVPYKVPAWAFEQMTRRMDPGFLALMRRVKAALDPQGILAPGRFGL
jgi:4-cresol dehydrogenase (hydroxylating)